MLQEEKRLKDLAAARARVSFLQSTLENHRSVTASRAGYWLQIDTEYVSALEDAKREVERLENSTENSAG